MIKLLSILFFLPAITFAQPDIIPTLTITGVAKKMPTGEYYVPVRVAMRNAGNDVAGRFKIHLEWSHRSFAGARFAQLRTFASPDAAYVLSGAFYAWTSRAFFVGNSFSFTANVVIPKNIPGKTKVYLRTVADSCAGEEFMPAICRIDEIHEDNNVTVFSSTTLPL